MKWFKLFLLVLIITVMAGSCSSVNELSKYNLSGTKVLFKTRTGTAASRVNINFESSKKSKEGVLIDIIYDIGGGYVKKDVEAKIQRLFNPDSIAENVSGSIEEILRTYYNIVPVESLDENPDIIVETQMNKYTLNVDDYNIYSHFSGTLSIFDRKSGAIVWKNTEGINEPFEEWYAYNPNDKKIKDINRVINIIKLMNMSDEEIRNSIDLSASKIAYNLSDNLREDIADSRKK
ncbi:MAG TPA: hypothetical protein VHP32_08305 [Ignavibacteria bacterium]|nr:hypothetical protein [Ignavibacteria bacterium]